jgi:hypothetical protein
MDRPAGRAVGRESPLCFGPPTECSARDEVGEYRSMEGILARCLGSVNLSVQGGEGNCDQYHPWCLGSIGAGSNSSETSRSGPSLPWKVGGINRWTLKCSPSSECSIHLDDGQRRATFMHDFPADSDKEMTRSVRGRLRPKKVRAE